MKKRIIIFIMLFIAAFTVPVFAENEEFHADDKVNVEENIDTTSFTAGNEINMSSTIDGINFVAGNDVNLSSTQDYIVAAGNTIKLENASAKDAFIAGYSISIKSSNVRSLFAAGNTIDVYSEVLRDAYLAGNKVTIHSTINGDARIAASEIVIGEEAVINGILSYPEDAKLTVADSAVVSEMKKYKSVNIDLDEPIIDRTTMAILSFLSLLVVAYVLLLTNNRFFKQIDKEEKNASSFFKTVLIGLASLIAIPLASIIIMITIIGIPLGIISLILYGIFLYLAFVPTAYYLGNWILKDKIKNDYLLLGLSLLVVYVLKYLPIIGGLAGFIFLTFGLGTFVISMKNACGEKK